MFKSKVAIPIVRREMSSSSSMQKKRKEDNDLSIAISRLVRARTAENSIFPVAPFITRYRLVLPPFVDLFHADEINSAWRYLSSESNARSVRLDWSVPINRTELVLKGETISRGWTYLFLSIFPSLRNSVKFFTTVDYRVFQSNDIFMLWRKKWFP